MSVRIRLKRFGMKKRPSYRIVVMSSKTPRDGRAIEELGYYNPIAKKENQVKIRESRLLEWVSRGAIPTDIVKRLLNKFRLNIKNQEGD